MHITWISSLSDFLSVRLAISMGVCKRYRHTECISLIIIRFVWVLVVLSSDFPYRFVNIINNVITNDNQVYLIHYCFVWRFPRVIVNVSPVNNVTTNDNQVYLIHYCFVWRFPRVVVNVSPVNNVTTNNNQVYLIHYCFVCRFPRVIVNVFPVNNVYH